MIRIAIAFLLVATTIVATLALTGEPGQASLTWLGWRIDMTAAAAVLMLLGTALCAMFAWRLLLWLLEAPRRAERARTEARRRQAAEVVTRGFLAAAAGDGAEARRLAAKAAGLAEEQPGLVRLLAAQAAEAAGDATAAAAAYSAMLGFPDMRLAGHRGLMQLALARGDRAGATRQAEAAYGLARAGRWAWRALFEARLEAADWEAARELLKGGLERKIISPLVAERGRAATLAASAAALEGLDGGRAFVPAAERARALELATECVKLQPGFAPGAVIAARLLSADGKPARAATLLEAAWKLSPHPALWLTYRDLRTDETPRRRAERLAELAALNPTARESRILIAEAALIGGEAERALSAAQGLAAEPLTARLAGLLARAAFAAGRPDEARLWRARGASAAPEPHWSELDPEGRAFVYSPSDWARLAAVYVETGELIHPRLERGAKGLTEAPDLPLSYADAAAFLPSGGADPSPYPIGEGLYEDEEPPTPPPPAPAPRRPAARRRLASAPRAAK